MTNKTKKIFLIVFLALFFYLVLINTNSSYATSYYVDTYYTINMDTDPYSGQAGCVMADKYYFEYPFDTDTYDYILFANTFGSGLVFQLIAWENTATDPYLMLKYRYSDECYVYLCDGADDTPLACTTYAATLSTDSTDPTTSDEWYSYTNTSNPLTFRYYAYSSWIKYTTTTMTFSNFRLYYAGVGIYLHNGSENVGALFTKSVTTQILTAESLEMLPTMIVQVLKILVPVGLVLFGILFAIYLARLVIWRLQ